MTNRRGLSRALAVIGIPLALSSVAAVVPAAASAATAAPARSWAALAGLGEGSGPLTVPSMLATSAGAAGRPAPALSAITGVVRGGDGVTLTGACVTASGGGRTVSVMTGTGGRYVLPGLRPGGYAVSYQDCARPARYFEQWSGGAGLAANASRVLVRADAPTRLAPVTLRLTSPAAAAAAARTLARQSGLTASSGDTISGVVRGRSGHALPGICVTASTSFKNSAEGVGGLTGRRGGYSLPVGSSGKWLMMFGSGCGSNANYAPQWWRDAATPRKATYLHARPGRRFRGIDATLRPGAKISGVVRSRRSGQPLGHVCVVATGLGPMSMVQVEATTRADGSYLIDALGTGRYRVRFDASCEPAGHYLGGSYPRPVAVTAGKTTTGINGRLASGGVIRGVVTSQASGAPLARICVTATDGSNVAYTATSKAGTYSFVRLRRGRYRVAFTGGCGSTGSYAPQAYDGQPNAEGATPIAVGPGQVRAGIDAAMRPGATITGRVANRAGTGLPGVCVALVSRNYAGGLGPSPVPDLAIGAVLTGPAIVTTGRGGRYRVSNMGSGQYAAEFIVGCGHGTARYGSQVFAPQGTGGSNWVWAGTGTVTAGVNATLRPGGSITGVVTGRHGRRLSGVCALAVDPRTQGPVSADLIPAESRRGDYRISGLAAGRYAVLFVPCGAGVYPNQWYRRKYSESAATLVPVRTGRVTTGINAALASGGALTGRILASRGPRPAARICVLVTDPAGGILALGETQRSGRYRIGDVPPGRWNLEPVPCLGASSLAGIVYHGVRVRSGVTHRVTTIRLPHAGRLAGTVVGGSPSTGQPGICVEATPITGDGTPASGATGPGGHYALGGLAPGRYRVLFTPECLLGTAALTPQWFGGQSSAARATPVLVRAGRTTLSIGARLAADGGIAGTVSTGTSADVGVCVGAFAPGRPVPTALAITAAGGRYELDGLAAGRYQVEFTAGCGDARYATRWYQGATSRSGARLVIVTAGSVTTGIDQG